MNNLKKWLPLAILPLILVLNLIVLYGTPTKPQLTVYGENGVWDLRHVDFENYNVRLAGYTRFIANALLSPDEYIVREEEEISGSMRFETHLTSRMRILFPSGGWYAFMRPSLDFSHRLYVNGEWMLNIGVPGANRETAIPQTGRIIFTAEAATGEIELVQQSSNFVHRQANHQHHDWLVGASSTFLDEARAADFRSNILLGSYLMLFLLLLMIYYMLRGNRGTLYAALFCLAWFFRIGATGGRVFTVLLPWLGWEPRFRLEYFGIPIAAVLTFAIIDTLFPKMLNKTVLRMTYIFSAAVLVFYAVGDTVHMSHAILLTYVVYGIAIVWLFACFAIKLRKVNLGQGIFLIGAAFFLITAVIDVFYFTFSHVIYFPIDLTGIAMLVFAHCNAIAVSITTMREFEEAKDAKQRVELAEESSKAKSEFLATMSHEIRTPLNSIIGIAQIELMQKELKNSTALNRIYASGTNLLGIINDILDMSKIESGKLEIVHAKYDTPSLINDTVQLNIVRIGSKPIEFVLNVDENLPLYLNGDELRIKQVLNNLLSNAIKYTDKGQVKLSVSHQAEGETAVLRFDVEDTGQGMKPEDQERLFSEYSRFNIEANRATEGTGIGLSITKKLVEMMDGTITVESEYGKGSIFSVTLRQSVAENSVIGKEIAERLSKFTFADNKQATILQFSHEPMPYGSILIVDDVETNLYVAKGLMKPYQLNIETVTSGFDTLDKVKDGQVYDVIFMDHMMPQMDGIETTQKLREIGYTGAVVALTANAIIGNDEMFMKNGFDGFISKPIDLHQLNAVLNTFVRDRHSEEAKKYTPETMPASVEIVEPKLMAAFLRDAKKASKILNQTSGDVKLFTTTAHAMKAALANIGKHEASEQASALENAGINNDTDFISANTEAFIKTLEAIIDAHETSIAPDKDDAEITEDIVFLREQIEIVLSACDDYDNDAAYAALNQLKGKTWKTDTLTSIEKIYDILFSSSDFEEAAELCRNLLGGS